MLLVTISNPTGHQDWWLKPKRRKEVSLEKRHLFSQHSYFQAQCLAFFNVLILTDLGNGRATTNGNSLNPNNNPTLSSSFNSGLNNFGLKNSYTPGLPASIGPGTLQGPNSLGSGGSNNRSNHGSPQFNVSNLNSWNARNGKEIPSWLST